MLSALQVPTGAALLRSPRLFAPSVEGGEIVLAAAGTTENACTTDRRKLGCTCARSAERQRMQEAEANRIAKPMAASAAMPPRRALSFPRRRTSSSCKLPMEFSLGGSKGGISLFQKEISLPCFVPTPRGAVGSALRCKNPILHTFCRPTNNNPASFIWKETVSIWKSERNSGVRCRL